MHLWRQPLALRSYICRSCTHPRTQAQRAGPKRQPRVTRLCALRANVRRPQRGTAQRGQPTNIAIHHDICQRRQAGTDGAGIPCSHAHWCHATATTLCGMTAVVPEHVPCRSSALCTVTLSAQGSQGAHSPPPKGQATAVAWPLPRHTGCTEGTTTLRWSQPQACRCNDRRCTACGQQNNSANCYRASDRSCLVSRT